MNANKPCLYNKFTIVGVGLMGGSLGMALRGKKLAKEVVGWGRNEGRLAVAQKLGAIDRGTTDREDALAGTDFLVFATPIGVTLKIAPDWLASAPSGCVITDMASVKGGLVEKLTNLTGTEKYYAGSHPICGSEETGINAARGDLFDGNLCLLTPVPKTKKRAIAEVQSLWQALGMTVVSMAPTRHDQIVAAVSHLPLLVASALINQIGEEKILRFSGPGLKDLTRIAGSNPVMWAEILTVNKKAVLDRIDGMMETLMLVKQHVKSGEPSRIKAWLQQARRRQLRM